MNETFRLFGNLWLEPPHLCLPKSDLKELEQLLPIIRSFEKSNTQGTGSTSSLSAWDIKKDFHTFQYIEVDWWKTKHNVDRPSEYLVEPSGLLNSPVACHLYNPTFSVDDLQNRATEDLSSETISQMHKAGFSTQNNCFIFDHIARRDMSKHCAKLYPEELLEIHEKFTFELREHMGSVVEICWGMNVRLRMFKRLRLRLLPLWGKYCGVELFLEMTDNGNAMKRFIIFVHHPQELFYTKSFSTRAQQWRRTHGRPQDQKLQVAACLGGIEIRRNFYEMTASSVSRLPQELSYRRQKWKAEARKQLKIAFPDATVSTTSAHIARPTGKFETTIDLSLSLSRKRKLTDPHDNELQLLLLRYKKIMAFWENLSLIVQDLSPAEVEVEDGKCFLKEAYQPSLEHWDDCYNWEEIPGVLVDFIQEQEGLKFNRSPIASRQQLETAYHLLQKCTGEPQSLSIVQLAISVLYGYGWAINRQRKESVRDLLVHCAPPKDVVPRRYNRCSGIVLDGPFPYWARYKEDLYVVWDLSTTCGHPTCTHKNVRLLPLDNTPYKECRRDQLNKGHLTEIMSRKDTAWRHFLLLQPSEIGSHPKELEVTCQGGCGTKKMVEAHWTGHRPPKFLVPQLKCQKCDTRKNWRPTEEPWSFEKATVSQPALSKLWKKLKRCIPDIAEYPRIPEIYFQEEDEAATPIAIRASLLRSAKKLEEDKASNT